MPTRIIFAVCLTLLQNNASDPQIRISGRVVDSINLPVPTPEKKIKKENPITVCESLANPAKFSNKPVAIIGRIECGASFIDHVCFLVQDGCKRSIGSWPNNKILIEDYWEEGMPQPPSTAPDIDTDALLRKLSQLRVTTKLGMHQEPHFKVVGPYINFSHLADVADEWGTAYGLFLTAPKRGEAFDGAPAALITLPNSLRIVTNEGQVASPNR